MTEVVHKQVARIVGPHINDECIPWDADQVPLFRDKSRVPEELRSVASEIVERHDWVDNGCLSLTFPNRDRGEELGQNVWLGVFEALVTPGRDVRSLHAFIGGVMENQLIRQLKRRTRDSVLEPLELMTPDGPRERPEQVGPAASIDEQAWRASAMDIVLSSLNLFDRILVMGYAERTPLRALRGALLNAGDPRVTATTPENNIKTYQTTAIRRASKLLCGPERSRATRRDEK